jgi:hypothetical protein
MLVKDCRGCNSLVWAVAIGQGIRCGNSDNKRNDVIPSISNIKECTKWKSRKTNSQSSGCN